jgi:hypothetical protein
VRFGAGRHEHQGNSYQLLVDWSAPGTKGRSRLYAGRGSFGLIFDLQVSGLAVALPAGQE